MGLRLFHVGIVFAAAVATADAYGCPPQGPVQALDQIAVKTGDAKAEASFKAQALALDKADKGHSVGRHGPEISDQALQARIKTGFAPDGSLSPARLSTKFVSWRAWVESRDAALRKAVARGHQIRGPPADGEADRITIRVQHDQAVGRGFVGVPATREKIEARDPESGEPILDYRGRVRRIRIFKETSPLGDLTRSATTLQWNEELGRWVVAQHYPDARDWDPVAGTYTAPVDPPTSSSP
jgi:hypothetical protein